METDNKIFYKLRMISNKNKNCHSRLSYKSYLKIEGTKSLQILIGGTKAKLNPYKN